MHPNSRLANLHDDGWELEDGVQRHRDHHATFKIPPAPLRYLLWPGLIVKMTFLIRVNDEKDDPKEMGERMWVVVKRRIRFGLYEGLLDNDPLSKGSLKSGTKVVFEARHIIQIYWKSFTSST
jgi:hypothetical protein